MTHETFRETKNNGFNAMREYALIRQGLNDQDQDLLALDLASKIKADSMVKKFAKYLRVVTIGQCVYVQFKQVKLANGGDLDKAIANHLHAFFGGMTTTDDIRHSKQAKRLNPLFKRYWMVCLDWVEFKTKYEKTHTIQEIKGLYK